MKSPIRKGIVRLMTCSIDIIFIDTLIAPALSPRDSQLSNADSHNAMEDDRPEQRQSMPPVTSSDKALADVHMRSLQAFLVMHVENIRRLQDSSQAPSMLHTKEHLSVAHTNGTEYICCYPRLTCEIFFVEAPNVVPAQDSNTKAQLNIVTVRQTYMGRRSDFVKSALYSLLSWLY